MFTLTLKEARKHVNLDKEYEYDVIQSYINNFVFQGLQLKENKQNEIKA